MGIDAGRLRHLIDIQQYVLAQNQGTGEPLLDDTNWTTEATGIFAEVLTTSGRDFTQAMQAGYVATHLVTLRYRAGIVPKKTRFIYEGIKLYVIHPNNLEGKNFALECLCQSGDSLP